jgi:hypothetical protein
MLDLIGWIWLFAGAVALIMVLTIIYKNAVIREQVTKIEKLEAALKEMIELGKNAL